MAEPQKDAPQRQAAAPEREYATSYTTEQAPDLPDANVSTTRPDPVIDKRLVELRNAEAKRNADRVKTP